MPPELLHSPAARPVVDGFSRCYQMEYPDDRAESIRRTLSGQDYPLEFLPEGFNPKLIVDIGASFGASALYFNKHFPNAQIVSFEPSVFNFTFLETNTCAIRNITTHQCALSNETGTRPLFYGTGPQANHFSLLEFPENRGHEMVDVRCVSDEFKRLKLTQLSILKISAEACETNIITDLFENVPDLNILFLFVEYHGGAVRDLLSQMLGKEYEVRDLCRANNRHATMQFSNRAFLRWLDRNQPSAYPTAKAA